MKINQRGFGLIEVLSVLVIVGAIGFVGWYIWGSGDSKTPMNVNTTQTTPPVKTSSIQQEMSQLKEYSSSKVALNFKYPSSWAIKESLGNSRGMGYEGAISLTSPRGLILNINPNYGVGKGGGCEPEPTDLAHNTNACSTLEVLSKEKVALKTNVPQEEDVYLFRTKYTGPRKDGVAPASIYGIHLSNNKSQISATQPSIGAWFNTGIVHNMSGKTSIDTFLGGANLSSPEALNDVDVMAAEEVLRSLKMPTL